MVTTAERTSLRDFGVALGAIDAMLAANEPHHQRRWESQTVPEHLEQHALPHLLSAMCTWRTGIPDDVDRITEDLTSLATRALFALTLWLRERDTVQDQ